MTTQRAPKAQSMTGFASTSGKGEAGEFSIEIKSVNSRFLDLSCRLPAFLQRVEPALREEVSKRLSRGKIEIYVSYSEGERETGAPVLDTERFLACYEQAVDALKKSGLATSSRQANIFCDLVVQKDFWKAKNISEVGEADCELFLSLSREALDSLVTMREGEAELLIDDLRQRLKNIRATLEKIKIQAASGHANRIQAMKERIQEIAGEYEVTEERWLVEVALIAEKSDVTEEIVRLESHITQAEVLLNQPLMGKKLTFLQQELLREVNTITSKIQDAEVKYHAVEMKSELERIREQAQNLE